MGVVERQGCPAHQLAVVVRLPTTWQLGNLAPWQLALLTS